MLKLEQIVDVETPAQSTTKQQRNTYERYNRKVNILKNVNIVANVSWNCYFYAAFRRPYFMHRYGNNFLFNIHKFQTEFEWSWIFKEIIITLFFGCIAMHKLIDLV